MLNQGLTEEELEILLAPDPEAEQNKTFIHRLSSRLCKWPIFQPASEQHHKRTASSHESNHGE